MKKILFVLGLFCSGLGWSQILPIGDDMPELILTGNTSSYTPNGDTYLFIVSGRNQDGITTRSHKRCQLSTSSWSRVAAHPTGLPGNPASKKQKT